jgi:hypothetical protein
MLIQGQEGLLNEATVSSGKTHGSPGEREIPVHATPRRFSATDMALRTRASPETTTGKKEEALPSRASEELPFLNCQQKGYFPSLPRGLPTPVH